MPADLNLLFGVLALQMDFVSRDGLIAAMNAWVLDKARTLGDILRTQGALSEEEHSLLHRLSRLWTNSSSLLPSCPLASRSAKSVAASDRGR